MLLLSRPLRVDRVMPFGSSSPDRKLRLLRLALEAWVLLASVIGATSWVAQAVLLLWPDLVP